MSFSDFSFLDDASPANEAPSQDDEHQASSLFDDSQPDSQPPYSPSSELENSEDKDEDSTMMDDGDDSSDSPPAPAQQPQHITTEIVLERIEEVLVQHLLNSLEEEQAPVLVSYDDGSDSVPTMRKKFANYSQSRSFTSISLVLSYSHALLLSKRTCTNREVYYFYVTHFRSQKECDLAILDAAALLGVPRAALGFKASPRGWFCGDVQLIRQDEHGHTQVLLDGRVQQSVQGSPIGSDWASGTWKDQWQVQSCNATCILVVEKEGVYNRLSEDRFFDHYPCILVTGKGFPDLATRAFVYWLHTLLGLPVRGLADCDPFGCMVLNTYQQGSKRMGVDGGDRFAVPVEWVGLRPSQLPHLQRAQDGEDDDMATLPDEVFQELTELDEKRLRNHLLSETNRWTEFGSNDRRVEELENMLESGYKVELEALNWLGMDYCSEWVGRIFDHNDGKTGDDESSSEGNEDMDDEEKESMYII